jgi:hypothetical protein
MKVVVTGSMKTFWIGTETSKLSVGSDTINEPGVEEGVGVGVNGVGVGAGVGVGDGVGVGVSGVGVNAVMVI